MMKFSNIHMTLYLSAISLGAFGAQPATGQWSAATLSEARYDIFAVEVGGVALFAGGILNSDTVDIYYSSTNTWSTHQLSEARTFYGKPVRVGSKAFFMGGSIIGAASSAAIDIYDAATGTWSITVMPRASTFFATAVVGTHVFVAGYDGVPSSAIDVYDTATDSWSVASLSVARGGISATTVGNYTLFAGGWTPGPNTVFDTVDIYDASTGLWSVAHLSQPRGAILAETVGFQAVFAGGIDGFAVSAVDIFDANTGGWTTAQLSATRYPCSSVTIGSKALFIGGGHYDPAQGVINSRVVDIYDSATNMWSSASISEYCISHRGTTALDGKVFIAGQVFRLTPMDAWDFLTVVDVYDASADVWYSTDLSQERTQLAAVAVDHKAMFAGGVEWGIANYDTVDIYEEFGTEYCVASPNSTGIGAEMFMVGSKLLADDSLDLRAGPIPDTLSLFVYSPVAQVVPFGDGYSCVGSPLFRLDPPIMADGQIAAKRILTSHLSLVPGTLNFQCFYRDPAAGGTGLNASNGYAIDFVP